MANYCFGRLPLPDVENGHTFTGDNFTQLLAHTKIFEGKTGLTFIKCNLTNCDPPADSVCIGADLKHCEFCANVHPEWVEKYGLTPCAMNCSHVTATDSITIDGVVVEDVYYYSDKAVV